MAKIVIRTDASRWIGTGHVMRTLVLAKYLRRHGHEVCFACLPQPSDCIGYIASQGFQVVRLTPAVSEYEHAMVPRFSADYAAWLQRSVAEDVSDFLSQVTQADLVITDHYAIGQAWQSSVRQALGCSVMAIDDLRRKHDADIVLDQTLATTKNSYQAGFAELVGVDYALLADSFALAHRLALMRQQRDATYPTVLLSMGGIDPPNVTLAVLQQLSQYPAQVTVLLSPRAPHYLAVRDFCARYAHITHHDFVDDVTRLMLAHDIGIGAPGTTSWERACLGLPSILVPMAENQQETCRQLALQQAVIPLMPSQIASQLHIMIKRLWQNWPSYYARNIALCDGLGVRRVGQIVLQKLANQAAALMLVRAHEQDMTMIFTWQQHPNTRRYALNPRVPSWPEHQAWMRQKLAVSDDYFYLIEEHGVAKGFLRLERQPSGDYLISIVIAPEFYRQGLAYRALQMASAIHYEVTLVAVVLAKNQASQGLFNKLGFSQDGERFIRMACEHISQDKKEGYEH